MHEAMLKSMVFELAKDLKTSEDLNQRTAIFKKFMIDLSDHRGYEKY